MTDLLQMIHDRGPNTTQAVIFIVCVMVLVVIIDVATDKPKKARNG